MAGCWCSGGTRGGRARSYWARSRGGTGGSPRPAPLTSSRPRAFGGAWRATALGSCWTALLVAVVVLVVVVAAAVVVVAVVVVVIVVVAAVVEVKVMVVKGAEVVAAAVTAIQVPALHLRLRRR